MQSPDVVLSRANARTDCWGVEASESKAPIVVSTKAPQGGRLDVETARPVAAVSTASRYRRSSGANNAVVAFQLTGDSVIRLATFQVPADPHQRGHQHPERDRRPQRLRTLRPGQQRRPPPSPGTRRTPRRPRLNSPRSTAVAKSGCAVIHRCHRGHGRRLARCERRTEAVCTDRCAILHRSVRKVLDPLG